MQRTGLAGRGVLLWKAHLLVTQGPQIWPGPETKWGCGEMTERQNGLFPSAQCSAPHALDVCRGFCCHNIHVGKVLPDLWGHSHQALDANGGLRLNFLVDLYSHQEKWECLYNGDSMINDWESISEQWFSPTDWLSFNIFKQSSADSQWIIYILVTFSIHLFIKCRNCGLFLKRFQKNKLFSALTSKHWEAASLLISEQNESSLTFSPLPVF